MVTALALLGVVVVLFAAAALATREQPLLSDAPPDTADLSLPPGRLGPEDVAAVRFETTLRGYRMSQVDQVLARLADELRLRDKRIAELERDRSDA